MILKSPEIPPFPAGRQKRVNLVRWIPNPGAGGIRNSALVDGPRRRRSVSRRQVLRAPFRPLVKRVARLVIEPPGSRHAVQHQPAVLPNRLRLLALEHARLAGINLQLPWIAVQAVNAILQDGDRRLLEREGQMSVLGLTGAFDDRRTRLEVDPGVGEL